MAEEASNVLKFTEAGEDTRTLFIDHIEWDGSTTSADDLVITDLNDKELWVVNNKASNERAAIDLQGRFVYGLKVATIDAGTVYVYLR